MIGQNQETAQICITNLHPEKVVAFEKKVTLHGISSLAREQNDNEEESEEKKG